MAKRNRNNQSLEKDLVKVRSLLEQNKLERYIKKLNPDNVRASIKNVPKEVIRILLYLRIESDKEDCDKTIELLKPEL